MDAVDRVNREMLYTIGHTILCNDRPGETAIVGGDEQLGACLGNCGKPMRQPLTVVVIEQFLRIVENEQRKPATRC